MKHAIFAAMAMTVLTMAAAATPGPADFRWQAPMEVPAGSGLVRARLPADAFAASQSSNMGDLRVFNGEGHPVPFAFMAVQEHLEPPRSEPVRALPLYSATADHAAPRSAIRVHIDDGTAGRSVWVEGGEKPQAEGVRRLDAALFDLRAQGSEWTGIDISGTLPANTPVRVNAWTSADLSQWEPLPLSGRLFRFEGEGAPSNNLLKFDFPRTLHGRYLRLDWQGQSGVVISELRGIVGSPAQRTRTAWPLRPLRNADGGAFEIDTGFASPLAGLRLQSGRDNTLVPVRILVRTENSQPWRAVGQTVVYRLGAAADLATNPPLDLPRVLAMHIRIEPTQKGEVLPTGWDATALFDPVEVVFVPSGPPPFTLAAGLPGADAAALPLQTLAQAQGAKPLETAPEVKVGPGRTRAAPLPGLLERWWPEHPGSRTAALWAVLASAVLVLGAVAFALARQIRQGERNSRPPQG